MTEKRARQIQLSACVLGVAAMAPLAGCYKAPPQAAGTGAKETSQEYLMAVIHRDWTNAYGFLSEESKARVNAERFARLGESYHRSLEFEPLSVFVTACEEKGTEAIAHVTIGGTGPHRSRFRDSLVLHRDGSRWSVVLPSNFGAPPRG
jgi:hypothetical protein